MVKKTLATRETSNRFVSILLVFYHLFRGILLFFIPDSVWRPKDVKDEIILITGGGSGIGQRAAINFLKLGAIVIIWDVNADGMETTKKMAKEEKLDVKRLHSYVIDLCDPNAIYEKAKQVKNEVGPIDILINNAGIVSGTNFLDIPDHKINLTFKVNVLAHFYTIKAFLPDMIERKKGHIVTVASVAGNIGVCSLTDYCASKYANVGMDYSLRMELAQADLEFIKTTIIKPYFITTGLFAGADPGVFKYLNTDEVADKMVQAILLEKEEVYIPGFMGWLLPWIPFLPSKAIVPVYDFIGGYQFMANFHGKQPAPSSKSIGNGTSHQNQTEINNNSK